MFDGTDLIRQKDRALRRIRGREISMIFQDPMTSLNPVLTIGRQIRESLETHFDMDARTPRSARPSCSIASAFPALGSVYATTRTSSRVECASAR